MTGGELSRFCQAVSSVTRGEVWWHCSSVEQQIGMRQSLNVRKIHWSCWKFSYDHHLPCVGVSLKIKLPKSKTNIIIHLNIIIHPYIPSSFIYPLIHLFKGMLCMSFKASFKIFDSYGSLFFHMQFLHYLCFIYKVILK